MGYRGKVKEQEWARALRAQNRTLADIAEILGVSKSSVSIWVRDVPFTPTLGLRGPYRRPRPANEAKLRQIEAMNREGVTRIGTLSEQQFLVAGVALYAGDLLVIDDRHIPRAVPPSAQSSTRREYSS